MTTNPTLDSISHTLDVMRDILADAQTLDAEKRDACVSTIELAQRLLWEQHREIEGLSAAVGWLADVAAATADDFVMKKSTGKGELIRQKSICATGVEILANPTSFIRRSRPWPSITERLTSAHRALQDRLAPAT